MKSFFSKVFRLLQTSQWFRSISVLSIVVQKGRHVTEQKWPKIIQFRSRYYSQNFLAKIVLEFYRANLWALSSLNRIVHLGGCEWYQVFVLVSRLIVTRVHFKNMIWLDQPVHEHIRTFKRLGARKNKVVGTKRDTCFNYVKIQNVILRTFYKYHLNACFYGKHVHK